jgi:hypothetical protein
MEIDVRRLLPNLDSLLVAGGGVDKNLADDKHKELLHDAKGIRSTWLVISG